jgi:5'(3')-deoxyribonucleotidase
MTPSPPPAAGQFVLAVDLDGVVADFQAGLKPIAAEWLGVDVHVLSDEVSYGFPEWGLDALGGYEALHRFAVKERGLFAQLPEIPGAGPALRRISTAKVRIRIVTHRLYIHWFHRDAVHQTVDWLEQHAIPYWDLCFMRDKSAVGAHLYLEDNADNVEALRADGHETIVFENSTNRHVAGPKARSWQEMEAMIGQALAAFRAGT